MYVCLCHGLCCRDVKEACGKGASCPREVFDHFDVTPICGLCEQTVREMLESRPGAGERSSGGCAAA